MTSPTPGTYCLATVTTSSFLPGTMVLLSSFLETNFWFKGDIVIFADTDALTQEEQALLSLFKNVKMTPISPPLLKSVAQMMTVNPSISGKNAHFYSLEAFNLTGYEKVLFCDSDLLFLDSIEPLFSQHHPLICGGDGAYYQGLVRNKISFAVGQSTDPENEFNNTFNAGLMLIDKSLISHETYADLVDLTQPKYWMDKTTPHTDQRIFNQYFAGKQHIIEASYNYLFTHRHSIEAMHPCDFQDIKVLHFNGPNKPWRLTHALLSVTQSDFPLASFQHAAFHRWHQQYIKLMAKLHLSGFKNVN